MARRFAKVSEEEIEEAFFYPSDLVNTKTAILLRVGEERWIYTSTLRVSVYIHHYSPPLRSVLIGSRNSEYPWLFTVLRTERKMARRFAKVSEEEIKTKFFYPSDLVNTKTTIPLRVGEDIYTSTHRVSVYIHHYSPPLRGIVVYYFS